MRDRCRSSAFDFVHCVSFQRTNGKMCNKRGLCSPARRLVRFDVRQKSEKEKESEKRVRMCGNKREKERKRELESENGCVVCVCVCVFVHIRVYLM